MGGVSAAFQGAMQRGSERQDVDAQTKELNRLRTDQLRFATEGTGGLSSLLQSYGDFRYPSETTQSLINAAVAQSIQGGGLDPSAWYNQSRNLLDYSGQSQNLAGIYAGNAQNIGDYLQSARSGLSGLTAGNLDYINNGLAPQLLGSGQDYFRQILSPQLSNQYALMGLARSGANQEAQAKGAASISLPISQLIAQLVSGQLSQNYAGQQGLLGQGYGLIGSNLAQGSQAQGNLFTQYLQNLYGLNQQRPNVDLALRQGQLGILGQGIQFSDYPRQQAEQNAQGTLGGYLSAFNATPYTPIKSTETSGYTLGGSVKASYGASGLDASKV